jgi:hypothetical protein
MRVLLLAALAAGGALPGAALEQGPFGGPGPADETEPNDRLSSAGLLGLMPAYDPLAVWGEIAHRNDLDVYRVDVGRPTSLDIRVVTGACSLPLAGSGATGSVYTASFFPVLQIYGPDGRLVLTHVSVAPNLLLLDLAVPLFNQSFYVRVSAFPGSLGPYALQVKVH